MSYLVAKSILTVAAGVLDVVVGLEAPTTGLLQALSLRMLPLLQLVHVEASVQVSQVSGQAVHVSVPGYSLLAHAVHAFLSNLKPLRQWVQVVKSVLQVLQPPAQGWQTLVFPFVISTKPGAQTHLELSLSHALLPVQAEHWFAPVQAIQLESEQGVHVVAEAAYFPIPHPLAVQAPLAASQLPVLQPEQSLALVQKTQSVPQALHEVPSWYLPSGHLQELLLTSQVNSPAHFVQELPFVQESQLVAHFLQEVPSA